MMRIFAVYFVFLTIIMAGCSSTTTDHLPIDELGLELQDEERKDLEHKKNIEELELQQSELLEGLLEEDSFAESLSEVTDDNEQYTYEEDNVEEGDQNNEEQSQFIKLVKDITSKGFVRNNYRKKLVDLSDIRISLKGKKVEGAYPPWKTKKN